ncbi:hypothetical protein GGR53DRAFT_477179 [Hypoxylon sp. FL1150]|nr:hypothetical protein GGR53DRAFT_477179 [Hypoxylon sp. FL1150]
MEHPGSKLVNEFRSLLDEGLILSISNDYNLQDASDFAVARNILLALSQCVEDEEASGFNPSGFGGDDVAGLSALNLGDDVEETGIAGSDVKSSSDFTITTDPSTSTSSGSSKAASGDSSLSPAHVGIFDGLSDGEKEQSLSQMFVELKLIDIRRALEKVKGDASLAMDELLNLQWLESEGHRPRGIDGFFVDEDHAPGKKKRGKKKNKGKGRAAKVSSPGSPVVEDAAEGSSQTTVMPDDSKIRLVAERLDVPPADVTVICSELGGSLGATVVQLLDNFIQMGVPDLDPDILPAIQRETVEFSWVPPEYIKAIFQICRYPDDSLDVIQILADHFERPAYLRYDVSYSVVAADPEAAAPTTIDLATAPTSKQSAARRRSSTPRFSVLDPPRGVTSLSAASAASRAWAESRNHSFSSAAAAFRRGRSDPHFKAAGSYYAERAREEAASYRQASRVEARLLVDRNSTRGDTIDLHGVTVADGVEIAIDRTWRWWDGLGGEDRARRAKEGGFRIITGLGRHSVDGKSPLRTAVAKALLADGWKVEVGTGSYTVVGRHKIRS